MRGWTLLDAITSPHCTFFLYLFPLIFFPFSILEYSHSSTFVLKKAIIAIATIIYIVVFIIVFVVIVVFIVVVVLVFVFVVVVG